MRYLGVVVGMVLALLATFAVVEWLGIPVLTDPQPWLDRGGVAAAVTGVGLLVADVALPVPSSLVMVAHGALFGALVGTALSLAGSVAATLVGFAIGRRGGGVLDRLVGVEERRRADALLERWGVLALLVSRPVPILAETVAILAGASRLRWGRAAVAALIGSLPAALLYGLAGAVAVSFGDAALVFGAVLALGAVVWLVGVARGSGRGSTTDPREVVA
jgi:uncharacterized membrane protein YdjX (TVP38/TMEM64 family)